VEFLKCKIIDITLEIPYSLVNLELSPTRYWYLLEYFETWQA